MYKYLFFSMSLLSVSFALGQSNESYDSLWEKVEAFQNKSLPQSAYTAVEGIYEKAKADKRDDQLIKAMIYKLKLSASFQDKDPADDILVMESDIGILQSDAGRAIWLSLVGESYHTYGIQNMYRYNNRTELNSEDDKTNAIEMLSLEELQKRSIDYFLQSLDYKGGESLDNYGVVLKEVQDKPLSILASNVREFLLFRAIGHFGNNSAFIALPEAAYEIKDEVYMSTEEDFLTIQQETIDTLNYKSLAIKLYQEAIIQAETNSTNRQLLNIDRLNYVKRSSSIDNKEELYIDALQEIAANNTSSVASQYAYFKLIQHYQNKGAAYKQNRTEENERAYGIAFGLIQKAKIAHPSGEYMDRIETLRDKQFEKFIDIKTESVSGSSTDFLSRVEYRNVSDVYFIVKRLSEDQLRELKQERNRDNKFYLLSTYPKVREWSTQLSGSDDYNYHTTEAAIEGLSYGNYAVIISNNKNFKIDNKSVVAASFFTISDLSYSFYNVQGNAHGYVMDRGNGAPIENAQVDVLVRDKNSRYNNEQWNQTVTLSTDKNGRFEYLGKENNITLRISKGSDILNLSSYHYLHNQSHNSQNGQVHLFTDRAIYRPGQTIYFKGLSLNNNDKRIPTIQTGHNCKVILRDANYQVVSEQSYTTNEYGTISGTFVIPDEVLTGNFTLSTNDDGYLNIKVEEYKRPKIYGEFEKMKESYQLGDTIKLIGHLKSFSGSSNEGATVKYRVTKTEIVDYFRCGYYRRPPMVSNKMAQVSSGVITTGEGGEFVIEFPTDKDNYNRFLRYNYKVTCDITDITGETTNLTKNISLLDKPFSVQFDLPEITFEDDLKDVIVTAKNIESQPIPATVDLRIYELAYNTDVTRSSYWKSVDRSLMDSIEMKKRFPLDSDGEIDLSNNKVKRELFSDTFNTDETITAFKDLKSGLYKADFVVTDMHGNQDKITKYISISDHKKKAIPTKNFWVSKLKDNYEPGDQLKLVVNTPYDQFHTLYKISKGQEILKEGWVTEKDRSIEYTVTEGDRGNLNVELLMIHHNRVYHENKKVIVPWTNKTLDLKLSTFRNKIEPGSKEKYTLSITDHEGKLADAEVVASIYDESLDQFYTHNWSYDYYPQTAYTPTYAWGGFGIGQGIRYAKYNKFNTSMYLRYAPEFDWFGYRLRNSGGGRMMRSMEAPNDVMMKSAEARGADITTVFNYDSYEESVEIIETDQSLGNKSLDKIPSRENLNETVFFYPDVTTEDGKAEISFTMNEALTKWKLRLLAHSKDLKVGYAEHTLVTQKNLMIEPHLPRFVRQGDVIQIVAKVTNLSDKEISASSALMLSDMISGESLNNLFSVSGSDTEIILAPGKSEVVNYNVRVPQDFLSGIIVKMVVEGGDYTDGEQSVIPVLSNRKLLTESLAFHIKPNVKSRFSFDAMDKIETSKTIDPYSYSLEVTSNPAWIVAKSIPYLLDADQTSTDNIFNALYGTVLADHLVSNNPDIKKAIEIWKQTDGLNSPLSKNSELKISNIELTPWLRDAQAEEYNMQRLAFLTDGNNVSNAISNLQRKLKARQLSDGGFSWTSGGRANWYTTQLIVEGIEHLRKLGIDTKELDDDVLPKAHRYIDSKFIEYYLKNKKRENEVPSPLVIHYLYTKSYNIKVSDNNNIVDGIRAYRLYCQKNWNKVNTYQQALICLSEYRRGNKETSDEIMNSLNERMIQDEEVGNYWNDMAGYYWHNPSVEKQALMIELYEEMEQPQGMIDGLKLWLLKNKQVNSWNTTKSTTAAIYAFMINGEDWLSESEPVVVMLPELNETVLFENTEYASGYAKRTWKDNEVQAKRKTIEIDNPNKHIAWGASYFQYFEDLNAIEQYTETPLKLEKKVHKVTVDDIGEVLLPITESTILSPGDKLRIRIELRVDRPMDYIQMRDMRSSGVEPYNVLSSYKWQDGLGYYESTKDQASYFYFDNLPKGNYVFEYDVYASHAGQFSNGITEIQSMYAPEFSGHSEGVSISIE